MRRMLTVLAVCFGTVFPAFAEDAARIPIVGVMRVGPAANNEPFAPLFREALAARGYVDGRNLRLDYRFADGDPERFPAMAEALVKYGVSVIIVFSDPAARATQRTTHTIPIIAVVNDLVASGLATSLARPGGNITGFNMLVPELGAKKLQILTEMLPAARNFAVLSDTTAIRPGELQAMQDAARVLGVALQTVDVRSPSDFATAFDAMRAGGAKGVDVLTSSMLFNFRNELGALALARKLPAICEFPEMVAAGCLASYGTSLRELYSTLAELTAEILNGASPADTPARQPTRFELVINAKAAKALGITIPPAILAQADEVIE
jgi:ABC-type uncharacterized transport system substrate-binding protein